MPFRLCFSVRRLEWATNSYDQPSKTVESIKIPISSESSNIIGSISATLAVSSLHLALLLVNRADLDMSIDSMTV